MYRIYRNLHKKCFSIQAKVPGKGWRVIDYADDLLVHGVTFQVSKSGHLRVLATGRKNVHAFVRANSYSKASTCESTPECSVRVSYNPKVAPVFLAGGVGVQGAAHGRLTDGRLYVSQDWW